MPLFHGFGLGVCVHTMLSQGGRCILVPRFTAKSYAKLITKYHCNFIAGVPTLYEALLRLPSMENADLSSLKGVFSGGDSLSIELKKKLDKFLYAHGAPRAGARGLRHHRDRHGLLPDAAAHVQGGQHRRAVPGHLHQDRRAGHRQGGSLWHRGRGPARRSHRDEGVHEASRRDRADPAPSRRRPHLGLHRRPRHDGRRGLRLLPAAAPSA